MKYLVNGTDGPGFTSAEEALAVLEKLILPTFARLIKLEADDKVLAGGLPVGARAFSFIIEAASHEELDDLLRSLPAWGLLNWSIIPLQSFDARAAYEQRLVDELKKEQLC